MSYYLYVIKLEEECYYVGFSENLHSRLDAHFNGEGAKWTQLHKPIKGVCLEYHTNFDKHSEYENILTLKCMKKYGIDNVRGGAWCQTQLYEPSRIKISRMINDDVCFNCKNRGYHTKYCNNKYIALSINILLNFSNI